MLIKTRKKQTQNSPSIRTSPQLQRITARLLDRLADAELQHGHHAAAEQLSRRATEMREAAP